MNAICDLTESTYAYLSEWHEKTQDIIEQMKENGETLNSRLRRALSENHDALAENLKTIFRVLPYLAEHEDKIVNDFPFFLSGNMSVQAQIEETEKKFEESTLS